jgi:RNA-splicing ligase RtcB
MQVRGKYAEAVIFTEEVEQEALAQIINILNQPMMKGVKVRIMPDVHAGAGICIGYTATLNDYVVPNFIGVDIGCGMTALPLGKLPVNFPKLDKFIRNKIPNGNSVYQKFDEDFVRDVFYGFINSGELSFPAFKGAVNDTALAIKTKPARHMCSIGTLGGGNHFISLDENKGGELFLVIHSGSRNFGKCVAEYHQNIAKSPAISAGRMAELVEEIKRTTPREQIEAKIRELKNSVEQKRTGLEWLKGEEARNYENDMVLAQRFAQLNRRVMIAKIAGHLGFRYAEADLIESVHNYINFKDGVIRKGAISAQKGEQVLIPLSMADGILYGEGLGNEDWNCSAPHGAGRLMSRSKAKDAITVEEYARRMKDAGVWSSCIGRSTLDEAPQAYKDPAVIKDAIGGTVTVLDHWREVYNFKAN